jgi:hypothetical protein
MNDFPDKNLGVIEGRSPEDWIAGTIPHEIRNESGDWRPFLPKEEKQYSDNTDTMACVSFSANNSMEIQTKFQTGQEVNFSDRFLAKMSGTTHEGNYLNKVADTIRNVGLVLENEWTASNYTWDSYYAPIPQDVINKAQKLDVAYEWIPASPDSLHFNLKHAPIQITIPKPYPNHAVVLVHLDGDTAYYFDTYPPYLKTMDVSKIQSALKLVLNTSMNKAKIVVSKNSPTVYICYPVPSESHLEERASLEGITIPNPIPNSDTL